MAVPPDQRAPALGYQLPAGARNESDQAHALVALAVDVSWLDDGAVLFLPRSPQAEAELARFCESFGRRHPTRDLQRVEQPEDDRLALRIAGPGAERWLRHSLARTSPTLGARLRRRARLGERMRTLTRGARVLPSFFIIGAPRSGTTTLFHALMQHPSLVPPARKELAFFNLLHRQGLPWYRSQFPAAWQRVRARLRSGAFATGDATPTYLFNPHAARRIQTAVPDARLIVLLRDPVERAYSHYHWARGMGYELLSFEEAVRREPERVDGELERMLADEDYVSFPRSYLSYVGMGRYIDQLLAWQEVFPAEQMLVLCAEDLRQRPAATLDHALSFLGMPELTLPQPSERNSGSYPPMSDAMRAHLRQEFAADDERLKQHLGWTPAWMRPG